MVYVPHTPGFIICIYPRDVHLPALHKHTSHRHAADIICKHYSGDPLCVFWINIVGIANGGYMSIKHKHSVSVINTIIL
jgi:hypothetical protein